MSVLDTLAGLFLPRTDLQARSEFILADVFQGTDANYLEYVKRLRRTSSGTVYRLPSVHQALGVPAILGAVTLISNTVGSLSLEAYRNGVLLSAEETPRILVRPNPFTIPRDFFRDTAFYLATRGEAWWWIAARDIDGTPMSLYPVPPWEITVAQNDRNRLRPKITWLNRDIPNDDIKHITYLPSSDGLRGLGPLQLCGAALSVTVEAQEWAANFFSGSLPSVIGKTEQDMSEEELKLLDQQWSEKPAGMPRWLTNGLDLSESPFDAQKAQLTESRQHQVGEAARMFSMPGALIEYQMGGSSLTYQNKAEVWTDFHGRCLSPNYLEPMEQTMGDLTTRSTSARFNVKQLLRGDPKTRYEVHNLAIPLGIYDAATAAKEEGYAPGNVDYAPVPLAPPQAVPSLLPINRTAGELRCAKCNRMLGESVTPPYRIACPRCKTVAVNDLPVSEPPLLMMMRAMLPAPAPITVNVPEQPAPVVNFYNEAPKPTRTRTEVQRDADGLIRFIDKEPVVEAG